MFLQLFSLCILIFVLLLKEFELKIIEDIVVSFYHFKFIYKIYWFRGIKVQWPEIRLDINLTFLLEFVFCHFFHFNEWFMHELAYIVDFKKHLSFRGGIYKFYQFYKHSLDMTYLFKISI